MMHSKADVAEPGMAPAAAPHQVVGNRGYGASPFYQPQYGPFGTFNRMGGIKNAVGSGEIRLAGIWRATMAEFFATTAFIFIGLASIVWGLNALPYPYTVPSAPGVPVSIGYVGVALVWGLAYFALLYATVHISAGYLNPALTFALMIVGKLPFIRGILYMIAQLLGAIVGAGLVKGASFTPFNAGLGGANIHSGPFTKASVLYVEIIVTAILTWVVLASLDLGHSRSDYGGHINALSPLAVGLAYFALFLITIPVDGGCMNPVRSFGSAVILNRSTVWHDQWIFWLAPFLGAIIGALVYELAFRNSYMPHHAANPGVSPYGGAQQPGIAEPGMAHPGMAQPIGTGAGPSGPTAV